MMLRQPDIVEAVVFAPRDLIKDSPVEPVGGLVSSLRIAEIVPQAEAYLLVTHVLSLLT